MPSIAFHISIYTPKYLYTKSIVYELDQYILGILTALKCMLIEAIISIKTNWGRNIFSDIFGQNSMFIVIFFTATIVRSRKFHIVYLIYFLFFNFLLSKISRINKHKLQILYILFIVLYLVNNGKSISYKMYLSGANYHSMAVLYKSKIETNIMK